MPCSSGVDRPVRVSTRDKDQDPGLAAAGAGKRGGAAARGWQVTAYSPYFSVFLLACPSRTQGRCSSHLRVPTDGNPPRFGHTCGNPTATTVVRCPGALPHSKDVLDQSALYKL
jgi:hypothetical protein